MKIKEIVTFIATMLILTMMLVACENLDLTEAEEADNEIEEIIGNIIGDFQYPENPAEQLRIALKNDIYERGSPMLISEVEKIVFNNRVYMQIKVNFTENNNMAVIMFLIDERVEGSNNPSFTIAFKDHDNSHDMIMVLTPIIKYLSPDLNLEEAERLATMQDQTISTDGFSMPQDIDGYQVQARYTNPHIFFRTPYFDAKLGVRVRSIQQLWRGAIRTCSFSQITGSQDYHLLSLTFWNEERHPKAVYGDFVVKNTTQNLCWRHGCTSVTVDVESMSGQHFSFKLDTWNSFHDPYEFGIGQKYTLFLDLHFGRGIIYAVQRSESIEFNSRGQKKGADMLSLDFIDSVRVWSTEYEYDYDKIPLEVHFMTYAQGPLCIFPVAEGRSLGGDTVWPTVRYNPIWEDYTFYGWFNNPYFEGEPYTNETLIFQNTMLFPKWIYSGLGGIWPRAERGIIHGIYENNLSIGQNLTITASGYNMNLESPRDKRFRWMPISWRLSDGTNGVFTNKMPFQANILLKETGEQWLYITYLEEIFDRVNWQQTGQVQEVRERLLVMSGD